MGERAFIISSGLTDKFNYRERNAASENNYRKQFNPSSKEIMYWVTVKTKTKGLDTLQVAEWYSPTGELWLRQTRKYLGEADPFQGDDICHKFTLLTKDMSQGVWMVRFIWNGNRIEDRYFSFGEREGIPTDLKIKELNDRVGIFTRSMDLSNGREYLLKVNSYLSTDSRDVLRKQEIFNPNYSFNPEEEFVYTLNAYGGSFVVGSSVYSFLFSPSGKLYDKKDMWIQRDRAPDYFALFKRKIKIRNQGSDYVKGLWKAISYYVNNDQVIDEKYFYIDNTHRELSQNEIDTLDKKISTEDIYNALYAQDKRIVDAWRKSHKKQFIGIIKNGMTKEYILSLLGKPDRVNTKLYDDSEVWVYQDVQKSIANAMKYSAVDYQILHGTGNVGRDLIGGAVYTIISAGIGVISANKLEIIMKEGKVVAKTGNI